MSSMGAFTLNGIPDNLLSGEKTFSYPHMNKVQNCSAAGEQSSLISLNLTAKSLASLLFFHGRHWDIFPNVFLQQFCIFFLNSSFMLYFLP